MHGVILPCVRMLQDLLVAQHVGAGCQSVLVMQQKVPPYVWTLNAVDSAFCTVVMALVQAGRCCVIYTSNTAVLGQYLHHRANVRDAEQLLCRSSHSCVGILLLQSAAGAGSGCMSCHVHAWHMMSGAAVVCCIMCSTYFVHRIESFRQWCGWAC